MARETVTRPTVRVLERCPTARIAFEISCVTPVAANGMKYAAFSMRRVHLRQSLVILLAIFLLLTAGRALADACEPGPPTGASAPVLTHLRSYPWTFHAPTRMALGAASSLFVSDPERERIVIRDAAGRITDSHTLAGRPISVAVDSQGLPG